MAWLRTARLRTARLRTARLPTARLPTARLPDCWFHDRRGFLSGCDRKIPSDHEARAAEPDGRTSIWPSRARVAVAIASTAWPNASALCRAGVRKPLTFLTYCRAAA